MSHTLKLKGEPVIPGLALPEAFKSLEERVDATLQLCRLKGSVESQIMGVITVCQELQHLLKCAFVENGMLATRIEILTKYHNDITKKMEKKLAQAEVENTITRKHMKRLRKRLTSLEALQRKKGQPWWDVHVRTTDYDSISLLSRTSGEPDLEFMLRVNQLMIDFVSDKDKTELVLPAMGAEERQEVAKLASVYKLRCRYGKAVQVASSTLLKARQAYMPAPGEVDAILESFTKQQKRLTEMEEARGTDHLSASDVPPLSMEISPSMLTPLSSLSSPTIDLAPPVPPLPMKPPLTSPPATPRPATPSQERSSKDSGEAEASQPPADKASDTQSASHESPVPPSIRTKADHLKSMSSQTGQTSDKTPQGVPPPNTQANTESTSQTGQQTDVPTVKSTASHNSPPASSATTRKLIGPVSTHHGQIRPIGHPTVLASPLKIPPSVQLPPPLLPSPTLPAVSSATPMGSDGAKKEGGGAKREGGVVSRLSPAPKRLRVTRRSVEEEHGRL